MVCDKGFGRRSPRDHVHHGGLHFQEPDAVQELPHIGDHFGPHDEVPPYVVIQYQVQVALPVACLLVLETKVQVRKHVEAGRQQSDRLGNDA